MNTNSEELDGRRQRSERSSLAIIEAALALMDDGVLVPKAQQIADRAGVGMRTFFRHFDDMEALFVAVNAHARRDYEKPFSGGDRSGSLEKRIDNMMKRRAAGYEVVAKVMLSTRAIMWRSEFLREGHDLAARDLRLDLENWLPEIKKLPKGQRAAIDAVSSFDMWHRLREHQKLSKKVSFDVMRDLLHRLLADA